jgi:hypothetical protein
MTGDSGPALSARGLGKRFGDRVAFEDVSFEIGYARCSDSSDPTAPARRRPYSRHTDRTQFRDEISQIVERGLPEWDEAKAFGRIFDDVDPPLGKLPAGSGSSPLFTRRESGWGHCLTGSGSDETASPPEGDSGNPRGGPFGWPKSSKWRSTVWLTTLVTVVARRTVSSSRSAVRRRISISIRTCARDASLGRSA